MMIENINVGDTFSTVTKLYVALGLPNVKGKQKQIQDKEIARYLEYEKTGQVKRGKITNEIVVTSVFNSPKEKIDNRVNNGGISKYSDYIDQLVMCALQNNNGTMVSGIKNIFLNDIPLFTETYNKYRQCGELIAASRYKVSEFSVKQYLLQVNSTVRNMFESSLKRLAKNNYIKYSKTFMVKVNNSNDMLANEYDENFHETILEIENEILGNMKCSRKDLMFDDQKSSDFYSDVNMELYAITGGEVWGYYGVYDIKMINSYDKTIMDNDECIKLLTDELILSIHKSLSKKTIKDNDNFQVWLTNKLSRFVVKIEKVIFRHCDGKILDGDVFAFSSAKIPNILHGVDDDIDFELPY